MYSPGSSPAERGPGSATAVLSPAAAGAKARAIAAALGTSDVLTLERPSGSQGIMLAQVSGQGLRAGPGSIYLATPALLRHYGVSPAAIGAGTVLVTGRPGLAGQPDLLLQAGDFQGMNPTVRSLPDPKVAFFSALPAGTSEPNLMITSYGAARLGLTMAQAAWLIQTAQPLTPTQINTARQIAAAAGITIETKSQILSLALLRNDATVAGILLALAVLAMTVGLIRSETAGDLRTLTATGASGRTRRAITGATAGALGLLAGLLGTVVAYLVTSAFYRVHIASVVTQVPLLDLALVLIGLPVVAAAGGWAFAGREPPAIARQPIG